MFIEYFSGFNEDWQTFVLYSCICIYFRSVYFEYMILIILSLCLLSQATFSYVMFENFSPVFVFLGCTQLVLFFSSIVVMFRFFRKRKASNLKQIATSFGILIATGVPTLFFFPFGIAYIATGFSILAYIGFACSLAVFLAIIVGVVWGRWNWKTHHVQLEFPNLPDELNGVKIIQISDVHIGSFFDKHHKVEKAIRQMNNLEADYVFFTGDLVNNLAEEMDGWEPLFSQIQAKKGKYSILGNHDYGDYVSWEKEEAKSTNLEKLIQIHCEIGFTPLLNESVELIPGFWLLGVENWGKAPFRQSGELHKTLETVPKEAFKLLLSHDPSHFDEQVAQTDIDLTLSGHTHGMQFGIERFGIKWSPISFRYKKWAGLYQTQNQFLYVNRGFGFLGFPGRVGIYPEITLFTLTKK